MLHSPVLGTEYMEVSLWYDDSEMTVVPLSDNFSEYNTKVTFPVGISDPRSLPQCDDWKEKRRSCFQRRTHGISTEIISLSIGAVNIPSYSVYSLVRNEGLF